jgi:hypothetical protein
MTERNLGRPWTAREDELLTQAVALHGENDNWKIIALSVPDRTNKACRKVTWKTAGLWRSPKHHVRVTSVGFIHSPHPSRRRLGRLMKTNF